MYALIIMGVLAYIIINKVKLIAEAAVLFIPMLFVVLPIIIIQQKEAYVNAGKKI